MTDSAPAARYHYPHALWCSFYSGRFYADAALHWGWKDILPCVVILGWLNVLSMAFDTASPVLVSVLEQFGFIKSGGSVVFSQLKLLILIFGKVALPALLILMPLYIWLAAFFGAFVVSIPCSFLKTPLSIHSKLIIALLSYIPYELVDWTRLAYEGVRASAQQVAPLTMMDMVQTMQGPDLSLRGFAQWLILALIPFGYMCFGVRAVQRAKMEQAKPVSSGMDGEGI